MKRLLGIVSVIGILCSLLLTGITVSADTQYKLDFTATDMVYDTTNNVWAKATGDLSCVNYPGYAVVNKTANGGAAAIRKFVAPAAGTLQAMWGTVFIDNGQGNLTGSTVDFAITDGEGKILFPTNGDVATVAEGSPLEISLTVESVAAGDEFYFVVNNPSVDQLVCVLNFGVILEGVAYSNNSGFLYDGSTQGGNGWYHQYAATVTKTTVDEAENKVVALDFTEQEMNWIDGVSAWGVGDSYYTGSWSNWGYVDQTNANIRKLVMPRAGTFRIEHLTAWGVTGVTTEPGKSYEFAVLDKDKNIVWPTTGGMATVTESTPAAVNVTLTVEAGDAIYFVFANASAVPTAYYTSSVISLDDYQTRFDNGSGGYGAADITTQGNAGWTYMYASDLTEVKAKDVRDMTALQTALTAAETITDLSGYTEDSAATFTAALTAAQAITKANSQTEIDAAAAALTAAINGLTEKAPTPPPPPPPPALPDDDPADPTVALDFTEQLMTYDTALTGWTADAENNCVIYPWASVAPAANAKVAIRKFVAPASGEMKLAWGTGVTIDAGEANFVITDGFGKIVYPENGGKVKLTAGVAHLLDHTFADVTAGDVFYFIVYNQTVANAATTMHSAVNISAVAYAENGNLASTANVQGDKGWYYMYATDLTEVKRSEYKTLDALNAQIAAAKAVPVKTLALCTAESVAALNAALAKAESMTKANTQVEIDAAADALVAAVKGLKPQPTADNVNTVNFTEKAMEWNAANGYWAAADEAACIITAPLNYPTPITGSGTAAIRKLIVPQNGTIEIKWGAGVYIDNTSGAYTGATVEFMIVDKNGIIRYPQDGGVAVVAEGSPLTLECQIEDVENGDPLYFISYNPSMANVPVVYNFAVLMNGTASLQNENGQLYGTEDKQGPAWYFAYANDLRFSVTDLDKLPQDPPATLPKEDPKDPTIALQFTEQLMTYDSVMGAWTADADGDCVIYPAMAITPKQNAKVALRKFVSPADGDLVIAWGNGISIDKGQANFVITDKYGKILYPEKGGKITLTAGKAYDLNVTFEDVAAGDVFYFVAYNHTEKGATVSMHSAINLNGISYTEGGNYYSSAGQQGAGGWWYAYATDLIEVKRSEYKTLVALKEQIAAAKAIPAKTLALYSAESVKALKAALAKAEKMTEANSQAEIDAATAALAAAIEGLVPKATASGVTKVTFTEKEMTYDASTGYWSAADDPTCIITAPLNYPTPVTGSGLAAIRKLVLPQNGTIEIKWGSGVYIDNTSGMYTGATVEFVIADQKGNVLYPQNGGVATVKEGTPLTPEITIEGLKKGEALYFISFNPSMANVPVVYNFAVMLNGSTSLQNEGGQLYGDSTEQGPLWYYSFASDLKFSGAPTGGNAGGGVAGETPSSPDMGDHSHVWLAEILLVLAASVLLLGNKFRKGGNPQ